MRIIRFFIAATLLTAFSFHAGGTTYAMEVGQVGTEDTMLMFVGEDLEVLSIASRREESASQAPAIASVIHKKQLVEQGAFTIEDALAIMPGFHMAEKEWGALPYLRGISNSVLFLYDTVPMGADSNKSLHQLDHNLSLAPIKRIEIIRGPGSVLWGPDAFAGIVNIVPLTGMDLNGIETGVSYNFQDRGESFYMNMGKGSTVWDAFLSISGRRGREDDRHANIVRFWENDAGPGSVPPEERLGREKPGRSRYLEATGHFNYKNLIQLSGRLSNNQHPYTISDNINGTWEESRNTPSGFIKLEASRSLNLSSSLRFTGYYSVLSPEYEIIDLDLDVREKTAYGEVIYDRSFFTGRGLLTGGASFREKRISDAPIWENYVPDFFGPDNTLLVLPRLVEENYSDTLWSIFSQYSHQIGKIKGWCGIRYDNHDEYRDHVSFNTGIVYTPSSRWIMKMLYGTAYRTPFSRQLIEADEPDQEKIENLAAQLVYKPSRQVNLELVAFASRIENHIKEDPYAQLSEPNTQDIFGIELGGSYLFSESFNLAANLTLLENNGPKETYNLLTAVFFREDGTVVNIFEEVESPYDIGPKTIFNTSATWRPSNNLLLRTDLKYFDERDLIIARTGDTVTADSVWLLDVSATIKDLFSSGVDLTFTAKNIFDTDYQTPGTYELIDGEPFTVELMFRKKW